MTPHPRTLLALLVLPLALAACSSNPRAPQRQPRETAPQTPDTAPPLAQAPTPSTPTPTPAPTPAPSSTPTATPATSPTQPPADAPTTPRRPNRPRPNQQTAPTTAEPATPAPPPPPLILSPADRIAAMREIHDPAIIRDGDWFYVFSTGAGIPIHRSRDLVNWQPAGRVFRSDVPDWAKQEIPTSVVPWAPDIALVDGRFVLTYTVATFGQNRSIIGMASTPTLDPTRRDYSWRHDGKVVESFVGDDFNAIDSNLIITGSRAALSFGSYWTGVKLVELDRSTLKPLPGAQRTSIARREAAGGIEAPFIVERDGWFYCFLSFDKCCRGVDSTYNVRVGRSRALEGPYHDRDNKPLMRGGGTVVVETDGRVIGPGHCAVFQDGPNWYLVHHFYDRDDNGSRTLLIRELQWDRTAWPRAGPIVGGL